MAVSYTPVGSEQRHTRRHPCQICGGHVGMPAGQGKRCAGYRSADGLYEHCQREQHAGSLQPEAHTVPSTYLHRLQGTCDCGTSHGGPTPFQPRPAHHQARRSVETRFPLIDANGKCVGFHVRVDHVDHIEEPNVDGKPRKSYRWEGHNGRRSQDMPLYNLPGLLKAPPGAPVYVTEGEKAAIALERLGLLAVATVTGASATPCLDALKPLRGHEVILWPDNDPPNTKKEADSYSGQRHMLRIADQLTSKLDMPVASIRWVHWPEAPKKGDAADYVAAGGTADGVKGLIRAEGPQISADEPLHDWDGGELLSNVEATAVDWLWRGYIPLGKLTVADGDPGLGKTTLYAAALASCVTRGTAMLDGSPGLGSGAGVVIFTAEDDSADTLKPRLLAAGGDPSRVLVVTTIQRPDPEDETKTIERLPNFGDLAFIERTITKINAKLVIFDPFMAYLPNTVNSFRDQDIRSALAPLARLAQYTGAAFVFIRHLNKATFGNALYRGGGSIGIIGAARSGLLIVKDPDDEHGRIFGSTKSNLGAPMPSWKFSVQTTDDGVPVIQWGEQSKSSVSEVLNTSSSENDTTSKMEMACDLLRSALQGGPKPQEELKDEAAAKTIGFATLRRAKKLLGIESDKVGIGKQGYWVWTLPAHKGAHDSHEGAHTSDDEHLNENTGHKRSQEADPPKGAHRNGYEHLWADREHLSTRDDQSHATAYPTRHLDCPYPDCAGSTAQDYGDGWRCIECDRAIAKESAQ